METWHNDSNHIYFFNHRELYEFFEFQFKMMELYQTVPLNDYQKEIFIIGCMEELDKRMIYVDDEVDSDLIIPVYQWIVNWNNVTFNMTYKFPSQDPVEIWGENWKKELGHKYKKSIKGKREKKN